MKAYKGFNKDMTCRGFQFEEGKTYEEKEAELCKSGFHACEKPLDVFAYYAPGNSVYHEVELNDVSEKRIDDSKVCAKKIRIGAELSIHSLVKAHVEYVKEHINKNIPASTNTGFQSASTNTGNRSASTNTGFQSASTNTGDYSASTNTGDYSASTNTGYYSASTNTGFQSASTNTGNRSASTNTGFQSASTNTGDYSASTNTGDYSSSEVSGEKSIAIAFGKNSKARGSIGCWIVIAEHDNNGPKDVRCFPVDGKNVKADTWYCLKDGKLTEVVDE